MEGLFSRFIGHIPGVDNDSNGTCCLVRRDTWYYTRSKGTWNLVQDPGMHPGNAEMGTANVNSEYREHLWKVWRTKINSNLEDLHPIVRLQTHNQLSLDSIHCKKSVVSDFKIRFKQINKYEFSFVYTLRTMKRPVFAILHILFRSLLNFLYQSLLLICHSLSNIRHMCKLICL